MGAEPDLKVVNLDKLTYAGDLANLEEVGDDANYTFVKGDICDAVLVNSIFEEYNITGVIHFAAGSRMSITSIESPRCVHQDQYKWDIYIVGGRKKALAKKRRTSQKKNYTDARFHHVSTDEVYGSLGKAGYFNEETPYAPNSPYSASKAASDFLVRSYHHTYGLNVVTSNCSNNYGPKQNSEKLIPTVIKKAFFWRPDSHIRRRNKCT